MKNLFLASLLFLVSSCAMIFNDKEVDVFIDSNPQGANVFIDGKNYGKTPLNLRIEPKNYTLTLTKDGYGSTQLQMEKYTALRNGKCLADAMGTMFVIPYYSYYWSGYCDDFKEKRYFGAIQPQGKNYGSMNNNNSSMMGWGKSPEQVINYYYDGSQNPMQMQQNLYGQQNNYGQQMQNNRYQQNPYPMPHNSNSTQSQSSQSQQQDDSKMTPEMEREMQEFYLKDLMMPGANNYNPEIMQKKQEN